MNYSFYCHIFLKTQATSMKYCMHSSTLFLLLLFENKMNTLCHLFNCRVPGERSAPWPHPGGCTSDWARGVLLPELEAEGARVHLVSWMAHGHRRGQQLAILCRAVPIRTLALSCSHSELTARLRRPPWRRGLCAVCSCPLNGRAVWHAPCLCRRLFICKVQRACRDRFSADACGFSLLT